jgi:N-methylhydantoinase B
MSTVRAAVDPVTQQVVQSNLVSIVDEMETNMTRTAYSPIVYEVKDLCAALLDSECRIIAQARGGLPIFLADMGAPVRAAVDQWGPGGLGPGDVVVTNAPGVTGQHLNNVVVFTPIFAGGELAGYAAVRAHWSDVGGAVPGSFSTNSSDIYAEGITLDSIKLIAGGREDPQIRRFIESNIRYPIDTFGDFRAQVAACRTGERRLAELVGRYGSETLFGAVEAVWQRSEEAARRRLADTPDGVYEATTFLDDDGAGSDPVRIHVRVTVHGDSMTVDLSGSSPQVRGNINCGVSASLAGVRVAFKMFTSPHTGADEGSFRPLGMIVPEGLFLSARPPAAMNQWSASLPLLIDTVLLALGQADPDRVPAGHHGSIGPYIWLGESTAGRRFVHVDTCGGGWGAAEGHDGGTGLKSYQHGDTYTVACEIEEAMYPLRVESYELVPDSGGAGRWRGGPATSKAYRPLRDLQLTFAFEREACPPWGKEGGLPGSANRLRKYDSGGNLALETGKGTLLDCEAGSTVVMVSGSGGGWGPPAERDPGLVESDVLNGYVSPSAARRIYGHETGDDAGDEEA